MRTRGTHLGPVSVAPSRRTLHVEAADELGRPGVVVAVIFAYRIAPLIDAPHQTGLPAVAALLGALENKTTDLKHAKRSAVQSVDLWKICVTLDIIFGISVREQLDLKHAKWFSAFTCEG